MYYVALLPLKVGIIYIYIYIYILYICGGNCTNITHIHRATYINSDINSDIKHFRAHIQHMWLILGAFAKL
jgi:hypothetical protein